MQPFDKGVFDKRFDDVIVPSIEEAGLEPYRVDRDPNVSIPIDDIEEGIQNARLCLAEITTDNPNVWFELGYAIAIQKDVVLICSDERQSQFPFDVQHRRIIKYSTGSPSDFKELQSAITSQLKALVKKQEQLQDFLPSPIIPTEGLEPHEMVALVSAMQNSLVPEGIATAHEMRNDLRRAGYPDLAVSLSIRGLLKKRMINRTQGQYEDGEPFSGYSVTEVGETWLFNNIDKLTLKKQPPPPDHTFAPDDDLPF